MNDRAKAVLWFGLAVLGIGGLATFFFSQGLPSAHSVVSTHPGVHILIALDTEDATIGSSVKVDAEGMWGLLEDGVPKEHRGLRVLQGSSLTRENILAHFQNLVVQPGDTILVYFSGHGGTDRTRGHYLCLPAEKEKLFRSELRDAIAKKNPALTVILTDCCASYLDVGRVFGELPSDIKPVLNHLLFGHRGVADWNACSAGQEALCSPQIGGWFTASFLSECRRAGREGRTPSWQELFPDVVRATQETARKQMKFQTPQAMCPLTAVQVK